MNTVVRLGVLAVAAANAAFCGPIIYSFSGTATGTLGDLAFNNAAFTLTSAADTSQVVLVGSTYQVQVFSSTIDITGFAPALFLGPTFWGDPQGSGDIIFGDGPTQIGPDLLGITVLGMGVETYNLQSSFGPIFAPVDFESSIFMNFRDNPTDQGFLSLVASDETFTASTPASTPEPMSMFVVGLGLSALLAWARQRPSL
jgi:hypothetical protein